LFSDELDWPSSPAVASVLIQLAPESMARSIRARKSAD